MSLFSDYEYNPSSFNFNTRRTKLDADNDVCWLSQKGWVKIKKWLVYENNSRKGSNER